jgi:hypothetical protein
MCKWVMFYCSRPTCEGEAGPVKVTDKSDIYCVNERDCLEPGPDAHSLLEHRHSHGSQFCSHWCRTKHAADVAAAKAAQDKYDKEHRDRLSGSNIAS